MSQNLPDTFCITPWNHLATTSQGNLRVCCMGKPGKNEMLHENGSPVAISQIKDVTSLGQLPFLSEVRKQVMEGDVPHLCVNCRHGEKNGSDSLRLKRNKIFKHQMGPFREGYEKARTSFDKISHLDLRFGNVCNLGCRMCHPRQSRYLVREWKDLHPGRDFRSFLATNWYENPDAWTLIFSQVKNLERIYITGGEPMLAKAQYRLFEKCIEENVANKIIVEINTNATILDPYLFDLLRSFQSVRLYVSIDGIGPLNEYIRYPSRWSALEQNLIRLNDIAQRNQNLTLIPVVTVQAYNILALPEIMNYFQSQALTHLRKWPELNVLYEPFHMRATVLPKTLRTKAARSLQNYLEINRDLAPSVAREIGALIKSLLMQDDSAHLPEFVRVTEFFDQQRNQRLVDVLFEIAEALITHGSEARSLMPASTISADQDGRQISRN